MTPRSEMFGYLLAGTVVVLVLLFLPRLVGLLIDHRGPVLTFGAIFCGFLAWAAWADGRARRKGRR